MIDGKENAVINKLVPGIVDGLFKPNIYGLVPCNNRNPKLDNYNVNEKDPGKKDFTKSYVKGEDVLDANIKDNGDGTITMVIQPKAAEMSMRGEDSQGNFFEFSVISVQLLHKSTLFHLLRVLQKITLRLHIRAVPLLAQSILRLRKSLRLSMIWLQR